MTMKEALLLKVLGEPTRLRLAVLLARHGETCVCHLVRALAAPQYRVSRHLGIMRAGGLVEARRRGPWMHYRLAKPGTPFERCLASCLRGCLTRLPTAQADQARLQASRAGK